MTNATTFLPAARAHTSLLAAIEKRALVWIAERLPAWVNSDHLTAMGFVSLVGAGLSYWYARWNPAGLLVVILFLALNWFGDSLDGTLARVRHRQRPRYGFYVDHILDAVGAFFLFAGLAVSGFMSPVLACGFLIAYLLLSIEICLATYTIGTFHLSFWKFGPTELRILLAAGNVALFLRPNPILFDVGGVIGIIGILAVLIQSIAKHTAQLYRAETLE